MYYFIEPMREEYIPRVQAIESQSFTTPWSAGTYRREIRNMQSCRYCVLRANRVPPVTTQPMPAPPEPRHPIGIFSQLAAIFMPRQPDLTPPSPELASIIGYGGLWLTVDDAHITTIAVDPQQRGQGLGALLLNALIDYAYELSANQITLEVRASNLVAQQLYRKYGFETAGKRPRYYTDNGEDALIMWTEPIATPAFRSRLAELRRELFARLQHNLTPEELEGAIPQLQPSTSRTTG